MHFLLQTLVLQSVVLICAAPWPNAEQQHFSAGDDSPDRSNLLNARMDAAINAILKDFNTPGGVSVAVVQKSQNSGWAVETKGYGFAKVDGTRVTEDTMFGIGSNSKLFDILATGLLISNKTLSPRISWDTKLASVMPEWKLMDPVASAETTILDAMSHRTGLPRHDFMPPTDTVSDTIRRLRYLKPSTGFREQWQYNNHMYTVLSYFPPLLTGVPFETYVTDNILEPLGMSSTTYFSKPAADSGHLADGMGRDGVNQTEDLFGMGQVRAYPFWAPNEGKPGDVISGAGGLISSARDMAIWLQTLLAEGRNPVDNKPVIPDDIIRRVSSGATVSIPAAEFLELSPVVYGGGQMRGTYRGFGKHLIDFLVDLAQINPHGGSVLGFKSQITRIPSQNFGVSVLSNDEPFGFQRLTGVEGFEERPKTTPRSPNPTLPSVPFSVLAGAYRDMAYGTLDLCLVSPQNPPVSPSALCRQLIEEIPTALPGILDPLVPTLLARWNGFGVTHVSLAHFERNLFNVTGVFSIPTGNSSDKPYWVQSDTNPDLTAEFSFDGKAGVGVRGFWGAGAGVQSPRGDSAQERAEVWFEKIAA
ncbi:Beta-lactamase class penicillin binding protein [Mycena sanguinolenta]|uniref:Beta-lactamase class penicillin binding protein n=1 Tax=Mycena sanguinolenta TaxID=230812 RepID=A0A8H6YTH3_9AGAR|nr:Beta-lactamase class penicillin binding protein [Mycena sanguinolenta]